MAKKKGLALLAVLLLSLLLLVGCGSKGSQVQGTNNPQPGTPPASTVQSDGQGGSAGTGAAGSSQPRPNGGGRLQEIAQVLGMTVDEVRLQMQNGKTLAGLIQEKGLDKDQVTQKLVDLEKARLEAAVKAGKMSQQQVDQVLADIQARGLEAWEWSGRDRQNPGNSSQQQNSQSSSAASRES